MCVPSVAFLYHPGSAGVLLFAKRGRPCRVSTFKAIFFFFFQKKKKKKKSNAMSNVMSNGQ